MLYILRVLGGPLSIFNLFENLPDVILNLFYGLLAGSRYRLFGKHDQCLFPDPTWKERFIAAE